MTNFKIPEQQDYGNSFQVGDTSQQTFGLHYKTWHSLLVVEPPAKKKLRHFLNSNIKDLSIGGH